MTNYQRHIQSVIIGIADSMENIGKPLETLFFNPIIINKEDIADALEHMVRAIRSPDFDLSDADDRALQDARAEQEVKDCIL